MISSFHNNHQFVSEILPIGHDICQFLHLFNMICLPLYVILSIMDYTRLYLVLFMNSLFCVVLLLLLPLHAHEVHKNLSNVRI